MTTEERVLPFPFDPPSHPFTTHRLYGLFEAIEPRPSAILLAISAEDSSIVYYKIAKGIVAPKEVKD